MNDKLYFILGDIFSNLLVGISAAIVSVSLINPEWPMIIAMLVGMPLGMLLALLLGLFLLYRYFGANEVMIPTMLSGMVAGMLSAMGAAMSTLTLAQAALLGAGVGALMLAFCSYSDYLIRGQQRRDPTEE